jgi:hypothetical protein
MSRTTNNISRASPPWSRSGRERRPGRRRSVPARRAGLADGKTPVFSKEIRAAGAGEAFPFDGTIFGNDVRSAGLGAFDYSHRFDLAGGAAPVAATLTLG